MKKISIPLATFAFGICLGSFLTWQYAQGEARDLLRSFYVGEIEMIIKTLNEPNHEDRIKFLEANLLVNRGFLSGCDKEYCLDALEKVDNYEFKYVSP